MRPINILNLGFIAIVFAAIAAGCTSTEVVTPAKEYEEKGETITLSISCPDSEKETRASNDHVLRFSVLLYENASIDVSKLLERKEIIASDATDVTEDGETPNTVTFQVPEGEYRFLIIGDYIPTENVTQKINGHYPDQYYDTSFDDDKIFMKSFRDFKNDNSYHEVNYNCVNNDNYECFASTFTVTKTPEKIEKDVELRRIVSKVSMISDTPIPDGISIDNITFSSLDFFCHYNFKENIAGTQATGKILIENKTFIPQSTDAGKEFIYFYTLAPKFIDNIAGPKLSIIKLTVNFSNGTNRTITIPDNKITPFANYRMVVKGPFFSEVPKELGDITLHLSASKEEWNDQSL